MENNGVIAPNFKGFMVDIIVANWNAIQIIYGNAKKEDHMEDRKKTCQFYWTQSM